MSDDDIAAYEPSTTHFAEPFGDYGAVVMQSGIPVRVKDSGGQGSWLRVPQPLAGEEGEVLTVQPDLSAAWEPAAGGGSYLVSTVSIPNATLKSTNPTTIVPAAGANTVIVPVWVSTLMRLGTNAFTNNPNTLIRYNNSGSASVTLATDANWGAGSSSMTTQSVPGFRTTLALRTNQPVTFTLSAALTGNAANDNTADITIAYFVLNV